MTQPPSASPSLVRGVGRMIGRLLAIAIVLAAGVAGWFGVDQLALAEEETTVSLPALGDGLPTSRLNDPQPWRVFQLTYSQDAREEQYWFDLDRWRIRTQVASDTGVDQIEIEGDQGFRREAFDQPWVEQDAESTRSIASFVMGGIGPFLLTDLVPPDALGFTSLELEGTSKGERVYEVMIDAVTLREQHPLLHQRWSATTRIISDGSALFRIRVREDGYVVRIDGGNATVTWSDVPAGFGFQSPLAELTNPPGPYPGAPLGGPSPGGPVSISPEILDPSTILPPTGGLVGPDDGALLD